MRAAAALGLAVGVVAVDQVVKALVRADLEPEEKVTVLGPLAFQHTRNTGVAFSMLSGGGPVIILVSLAALGALVAFFWTYRRRAYAWVPAGLLAGGAAGNLVDRVRLGAVTDFVKLPHFPAFNVADACITIGVVALVVVIEVTPRRAAS